MPREKLFPDDHWWWRYGGWVLALPITVPLMLFEIALDEWQRHRSWKRWERRHGCPATHENLMRIEVMPRVEAYRTRLRSDGYDV